MTASDDPVGYAAHAPGNDTGVITLTAALSSFPYVPEQAMRALRHFYDLLGDRIKTYLVIDQGLAVIMIENYRTELLWKLFVTDPDVRTGLKRLGFFSCQKAR